MTAPIKRWTRQDYDKAAREYRASLPLEHFRQTVCQSTQREITATAFQLIRMARPDVHCFGRLLVQYFFEGTLRQVVPDNMIVLGDLDPSNWNCYALEHALPIFWTMEYVWRSNKWVDYKEKRRRYEQELCVPYYLVLDPDAAPDVLSLYKHNGTAYELMPSNAAGRYPIPELELEVGLLNGWARYWSKGSLLATTEELSQQVEVLTEQLRQQNEQLERFCEASTLHSDE